MRAVIAPEPGGPEALHLADVPDPEPGAGEVVIKIAAAGLNRADLMQRQGFYPPPPGASDILGMECSGVIAAIGPGVEGWSIGDQCCALLAAGGYATHVAVPTGQVMPIPDGVSLVEAAALPEVAATVWSNVSMIAGLRSGETFLVHGGAGGIGSFAIQLGAALGADVVTTVGSPEKAQICRSLGASRTINYHDEAFEESVVADVILDNMGASYLMRNVTALADGGRLCIIGLQGGAKAELNINSLLSKRGHIIATALRSRAVESKSEICASVVEHVWPLLASGEIRPQVGSTYSLDDVAAAHEFMESGEHVGKILLTLEGA